MNVLVDIVHPADVLFFSNARSRPAGARRRTAVSLLRQGRCRRPAGQIQVRAHGCLPCWTRNALARRLLSRICFGKPHIAENSTLIGLRLHNRLQGRPFPANVDVLIQASSRIASLRHSVDLKNFQGQSSDHPIQFRPGVAATAALGGNAAITALPPRVDLMAYERQTGRPIDYVLLYGFRDAVEDKDALARLDAQLRENYRLIYVSEPRGFVHLYSRSAATRPAKAGQGR